MTGVVVPLPRFLVDAVGARIEPGVWQILCEVPGTCIAGGFIRSTLVGETPHDIDICTPRKSLPRLIAQRIAFLRRAPPPVEKPNCIEVEGVPLIQIDRCNFTSPRQLVHAFDFTINGAVIEVLPDGSLCGHAHPDFIRDVMARRLHATRTDNLTPDRIKKFEALGYTMPPEERRGICP